MTKLLFVSRHVPTLAQTATARALLPDQGDVELVHVPNVTFERGPAETSPREVVAALCATHNAHPAIVAVVAPMWVTLELLRRTPAGRVFHVVEFVNAPSARERGMFVCLGAWRHALHASDYVACPMSVDEQDESSLAAAKRR